MPTSSGWMKLVEFFLKFLFFFDKKFSYQKLSYFFFKCHHLSVRIFILKLFYKTKTFHKFSSIIKTIDCFKIRIISQILRVFSSHQFPVKLHQFFLFFSHISSEKNFDSFEFNSIFFELNPPILIHSKTQLFLIHWIFALYKHCLIFNHFLILKLSKYSF